MSEKRGESAAREISALEEKLLGVQIFRIPELVPGLLAAGILGWLSIQLSGFIGIDLLQFEHSPISSVMMAILLGLLARNLVALPTWLKPGFNFAVKKVLRLGIILLGIRLSIFDALRLGALGVPIVLFCLLGALFLTTRLNKWLKLPERLGTLIAVGTSICGVSAIVATGPAIDAEDEEVAYAVAVITIFGVFATLVYPYLAKLVFTGDPVKAGLFLGTSIHDTSQVTGAALVFSEAFSLPRALEVATVTKLVRNVFMAVVIPFMALANNRRASAEGRSAGKQARFTKLLPLFVLGFIALAGLRSIGDAGVNASGLAYGLWTKEGWQGLVGLLQTWAVNALVLALAGVGLTTNLRTMRGLGIKPFLVGLGAALAVGVISFAAISLLGSFVTL